MRIPLKASLIALLFVIPACSSNNPTNVQAGGEPTTTVGDLDRQRDDYIKTINAKLDEMDQKFDGLDARAASMSGSTKDDFKSQISQLRNMRKAVSTKVDDVKRVSVESWPTMKTDVDTALANLEQSYENVSERFETQ